MLVEVRSQDMAVPVVVNTTGPVVALSSHPGGSFGVQSRGRGVRGGRGDRVLPARVLGPPVLVSVLVVLVVSVSVRVLLRPGPVRVLLRPGPVSVRVLFVFSARVLGPGLRVRVPSARVLGPGGRVRVPSARVLGPGGRVRVPSARVLGPGRRVRVLVLSVVGHSVTGGQVQS